MFLISYGAGTTKLGGRKLRAMTEPINLNKARKARGKVAARQQAAENRVRFGRTGAEKAKGRLERERADRAHEHAKRED